MTANTFHNILEQIRVDRRNLNDIIMEDFFYINSQRYM